LFTTLQILHADGISLGAQGRRKQMILIDERQNVVYITDFTYLLHKTTDDELKQDWKFLFGIIENDRHIEKYKRNIYGEIQHESKSKQEPQPNGQQPQIQEPHENSYSKLPFPDATTREMIIKVFDILSHSLWYIIPYKHYLKECKQKIDSYNKLRVLQYSICDPAINAKFKHFINVNQKQNTLVWTQYIPQFSEVMAVFKSNREHAESFCRAIGFQYETMHEMILASRLNELVNLLVNVKCVKSKSKRTVEPQQHIKSQEPVEVKQYKKSQEPVEVKQYKKSQEPVEVKHAKRFSQSIKVKKVTNSISTFPQNQRWIDYHLRERKKMRNQERLANDQNMCEGTDGINNDPTCTMLCGISLLKVPFPFRVQIELNGVRKCYNLQTVCEYRHHVPIWGVRKGVFSFFRESSDHDQSRLRKSQKEKLNNMYLEQHTNFVNSIIKTFQMLQILDLKCETPRVVEYSPRKSLNRWYYKTTITRDNENVMDVNGCGFYDQNKYREHYSRIMQESVHFYNGESGKQLFEILGHVDVNIDKQTGLEMIGRQVAFFGLKRIHSEARRWLKYQR
jgi:hypothetical protein